MSLYTLKSTDVLPAVKVPGGLTIAECTHEELLAWMAGTTPAEVIKRIANDHVAFVASMNNVPAAFGWMARGKARIGELNHELILPVGNRYLWNFRTMEAFRGMGIYPALLQFIINYEKAKAEQFWIIHAPENKSSLRGIQKAGFRFVGTLYTYGEATIVEATSQSLNQRKLLEEMDITVSGQRAATCWNCSSPYLIKKEARCCCAKDDAACTSSIMAIAS